MRDLTRSPEYDGSSSGVVSCAFSSCRDNKSNSPSHSRRVESIYELHVPRVALLCSLDLRLWVSPADSFRADEMTTDRRYAEQEEDQAERRDGQRVPFERTEEAKRVRGAGGPASL